ncbi:MAG: hypothetical protein LBL90_12755 [Prevotellaceae bacterium]|nr:hypothetical protein [Prevotellaceae bacterium]
MQEYILPKVFEEYGRIGIEKGFTHVESSPLVSSNCHLANMYHKTLF